MTLPFSACARDDDGHRLTRLWNEYYKAVDADKPKDQADILERIKKESAAKHLAWDYYDACWKYVGARVGTNWKLRDELTAQARREIEQNGEPVAVFFNRRSDGTAEELLDYVTKQKDRLQAAYNPEFYGRDRDITSLVYSNFLAPRLANDYEYALWSLFSKDRRLLESTIRSRFEGRYPFDALIEYSLIQLKPVSEEDKAMEAFADKYDGKAVAILARDFLLNRRDNTLRWDKGSSEEYRALARDCEALIAARKNLSGDEKDLADCATCADEIFRRLTAQEISLDVTDSKATLIVRNLPSVRVRILKGKKEIFARNVQNSANTFYLKDTLSLDLPLTDDDTYTLTCSGGKVETESDYRRYSLSIAHKRDYDGYGIYVADYITGEPLKQCDIALYDSDDKLVEKLEGFALDGFTYLPESFTRRIEDKRWGWTLQASARLDGRVRKSRPHALGYQAQETVRTDNPARHQAMLLTDRSAFNPGETVFYKVLLYEGTYEYAARPQGIRLMAKLFDPSGKQIDEQELTTNEFGSAAGSFVLKKGDRGGLYSITVHEGNAKLCTTRVRADEFVLPTFELNWKPDDRFYLPGDWIQVEGGIRSYSGHNLATATATYEVQRDGTTLQEGKLDLTPEGDFKIRFQSDKHRYYYDNYAVTVRVTDATGETLEVSTNAGTSRSLPVNISILNQVNGRFNGPDLPQGSIVGEGLVRARIQLGTGQTLTHPALQLNYRVIHNGQAVLSGQAVNGEPLGLDLSGQPSGLYTIAATVKVRNDKGEVLSADLTRDIVKAADTDTMLDLDVRSFFKEIPDDGRSIALQVGTTTGPAWIVTELYGDGNRLLEKRLVKLAGLRGRTGSLETIRFERKAGYPESLTLKVFWFRDGNSFEYSVSSYKEEKAFQLPLSFSRFLDTTAPHHDYSFTILTAAGTEVAATVFDKSTETIQRNRWTSVTPDRRSLPDVSYSVTNGTDSSYGYGYAALESGSRRGVRSKVQALGAAMPMERMNDSMVMVEMEEAVADEGAPAAAEPEENTAIRENFANTIAWEPFLRSDKDGVVTFNFATADKLSTYYVQLFAHDKAFHNTTLRREMLVTLPVKVAVVQPQFLYEGDRYVARVTLANSKEKPISGRLAVRFLNGTDYKTAPVIQEKTERITVPAGGSADAVFEISAPALANLGLLVNYTADNAEYGSDGVFVTMPVSPAVQTITEAHSAVLLAGMDRAEVLAGLRSQFVNVYGADAALREISILGMIREAVPDKVIPASENLLDQSESLFANYLLDILPGTPVAGASKEERDAMVDKILACRNKDGGFAWFKGMNSSQVLTAVLLERLAAMGDACPPALAALTEGAVRFLDNSFFDKDGRPIWCGAISQAQYLHVRSLYPEVRFSPKSPDRKVLREFKKETKEYLVPGEKRGLHGQVFAKARRMKTLRALIEDERGKDLAKSWGIFLFTSSRLRSSLDKDLTSLLQYAEPHRSGGTYYPNAVMPWRGLLESELYAHALLCDLMTACGHVQVAEGIRLWIMVQKETQHWEDDPAYLQAIGSVLHGTEQTLQTKVLALSATTTLPFPQIKAAGNGFTLSCTYFRDGRVLEDGDVLHVGDKVMATYDIWNEENRSFVRLTAPRPAAFRPVQQVSGRYGWWLRPISITGWMSFSPQGYRSVLADRTEFWFDSYPEEKTSLSEEYFVTQEGTFQSPVPVIESLYAPHYRANDDGKPAVTVKP